MADSSRGSWRREERRSLAHRLGRCCGNEREGEREKERERERVMHNASICLHRLATLLCMAVGWPLGCVMLTVALSLTQDSTAAAATPPQRRHPRAQTAARLPGCLLPGTDISQRGTERHREAQRDTERHRKTQSEYVFVGGSEHAAAAALLAARRLGRIF